MCWQHCLKVHHCTVISSAIVWDMASASYCLHLLSSLVVEQLCRANLKPTKSPFFWQPHLILFCAPSCICNPNLTRFSHLHLCSAGWCHHSPSPWTGKLAFKHVTNFMFSKKFIFQSEEDGASPRYWKITAPNQTAMTLEETGKPLLCAKPNKNTPHFAHFVPGGCPSGKNAEFPHIDADKRQVLPPGWLAGLGMYTKYRPQRHISKQTTDKNSFQWASPASKVTSEQKWLN